MGYLKCPFFSENTKNSKEITKYKKTEMVRKKEIRSEKNKFALLSISVDPKSFDVCHFTYKNSEVAGADVHLAD